MNVIAAKPSVFWLNLSLTARGAAPVTSLKLLMEVQIHSNCIPSSFYTSKRARITGDSQSRVRLLYFTRSRHLPVSICLAVSSKCCVSDSLPRGPSNLPPLLIYIIQVSHFKASMFQRNLQRIWGCIMSHMFAELAEIKRHVWKICDYDCGALCMPYIKHFKLWH